LRIEYLRRSMHAVRLRTRCRVGPFFVIIKTVEIGGFRSDLWQLQAMKSVGVFVHAQQAIDRCFEVQINAIGSRGPDAEPPAPAGESGSADMRRRGWGVHECDLTARRVAWRMQKSITVGCPRATVWGFENYRAVRRDQSFLAWASRSEVAGETD